MSNTILQGKVSFVNHEKKYILIEYDAGNKKKSINGLVDDKTQQQLIDKKLIKKKHQYHIGDVVTFQARLSDRGDRMAAVNIQFQYNNALDVLLNKAKTANLFTGYLKEAEGKYFIKEIDSYLFFPLPLSPWQILPPQNEWEDPVMFSLENTDKKEKVSARLSKPKYIAAYYTAVRFQKEVTPIDATIYKISPHGIYVNVVADKIQAKLPFKEGLKINDTVKVKIIYLGEDKIIIEAL